MSKEFTDILRTQGIMSKGYGIVPKIVMQDKRLSRDAKAIYAYMCSFAGTGDTAFPSVDKMCYDLNFGKRETLVKHRRQLEKYGYIKVEQQRGKDGKFNRNIYTLIQFPVEQEELEEETENTDTPKKTPSHHFGGTVKKDKNTESPFEGHGEKGVPVNRGTNNNSNFKNNNREKNNNNNKETISKQETNNIKETKSESVVVEQSQKIQLNKKELSNLVKDIKHLGITKEQSEIFIYNLLENGYTVKEISQALAIVLSDIFEKNKKIKSLYAYIIGILKNIRKGTVVETIHNTVKKTKPRRSKYQDLYMNYGE